MGAASDETAAAYGAGPGPDETSELRDYWRGKAQELAEDFGRMPGVHAAAGPVPQSRTVLLRTYTVPSVGRHTRMTLVIDGPADLQGDLQRVLDDVVAVLGDEL